MWVRTTNLAKRTIKRMSRLNKHCLFNLNTLSLRLSSLERQIIETICTGPGNSTVKIVSILRDAKINWTRKLFFRFSALWRSTCDLLTPRLQSLELLLGSELVFCSNITYRLCAENDHLSKDARNRTRICRCEMRFKRSLHRMIWPRNGLHFKWFCSASIFYHPLGSRNQTLGN